MPLFIFLTSTSSAPSSLSFPNSVWERHAAKLCFASASLAGPRGDAKQSFPNARSQTEFGNESRVRPFEEK
jgi:hypothetical protein